MFPQLMTNQVLFELTQFLLQYNHFVKVYTGFFPPIESTAEVLLEKAVKDRLQLHAGYSCKTSSIQFHLHFWVL